MNWIKNLFSKTRDMTLGTCDLFSEPHPKSCLCRNWKVYDAKMEAFLERLR